MRWVLDLEGRAYASKQKATGLECQKIIWPQKVGRAVSAHQRGVLGTAEACKPSEAHTIGAFMEGLV